MAAFMADYELFQIEITRTYGKNEWRDDIRKLFRKSGVDGLSPPHRSLIPIICVVLSFRQEYRFPLQRFPNRTSTSSIDRSIIGVEFFAFRKMNRSSKIST